MLGNLRELLLQLRANRMTQLYLLEIASIIEPGRSHWRVFT